MAQKEYLGGAEQLQLNAQIDSSVDTFIASTTPGAGWPTAVSLPFVVIVDKGTASEEKMLVDTRSGATFSDVTRGYDGTTGVQHSAGAKIDHCADASVINEASAHVNDDTRDDHSQYVKASTAAGAGLAESSRVLSVNVDASTIEISTDTLRVKASGITANEIAANAVDSSEIAANAVGASELADDAVDTAAIVDLAVTTGKINDAAVTAAKLAAAVAGDGLAGGAGTALSVNTDGSTIETSSDALRVKDAGITGAKLEVAQRWEAGDCKWSARSTPSTGWLLCDGSSLLRAGTYADLFTAIGTTFGAADGTHFNVPDGRSRTLIGVGTGSGLTARALAATTGAETVTLTGPQSGIAQHNHNIGGAGNIAPLGKAAAGVDIDTGQGIVLSGDAGPTNAAQSHTNMQPSLALNLFIKI